MPFKKYMHVERFGNDEVQGIELGECFVFSKLDGTNASVWEEDGLQGGSRNKQLTIEEDNAGFYDWVINGENRLSEFFGINPNLRLFGEWLVPHSLKTYRKDALRKFYIFDVWDDKRHLYLHYDEYKPLIEEFDLEYIPPLCIINNATYDNLLVELSNNKYLIEEGCGNGEGIVIKNYCVHSNMRILTKDLRWIPAGDIKIGDKLIGFTENNVAYRKGRHFRLSTVLNNEPDIENCYEIKLDDGTVLISTDKHPWLVINKVYKTRKTLMTSYVWKNTEDLKVDQLMVRIVPIWKENLSYKSGYLSGFLDGEGSLVYDYSSMPCDSLQVSISQKSGPTFEKAKKYMRELGFKHSITTGGSSTTDKIIITGGKCESLRFLGTVRPERLIGRINPDALGGIKQQNKKFLKIKSIQFVGKKPIMRLGTDTHTYIAEGFPAHNTYRNVYGRIIWAKIITNIFKEKHSKEMGATYKTMKQMVEKDICDKYVTEHLINKVYAKIVNEMDGWNSKYIMRLFSTIYHDLISEELWEIIKKMKNPTINFKTLNTLVIMKVKEVKSELF